MATVTVKVDKETKKEVSKITEYYGLDITSSTRAFYKQIQREKSLPLDLMPYLPEKDEIISDVDK